MNISCQFFYSQRKRQIKAAIELIFPMFGYQCYFFPYKKHRVVCHNVKRNCRLQLPQWLLIFPDIKYQNCHLSIVSLLRSQRYKSKHLVEFMYLKSFGLKCLTLYDDWMLNSNKSNLKNPFCNKLAAINFEVLLIEILN